MKRISLLLISVLMLGAPMFTAMPAVASQKTPTDWGAIQGTYNLYFDYGPTGTYTEETLTLNVDHSGASESGDAVNWQASHFKITLRFHNKVQHTRAVFRGRIGRVTTNFSSPAKPGTMSNNAGETGVWYAVKTS